MDTRGWSGRPTFKRPRSDVRAVHTDTPAVVSGQRYVILLVNKELLKSMHSLQRLAYIDGVQGSVGVTRGHIAEDVALQGTIPGALLGRLPLDDNGRV